jgi:hypothetical protein
MSLGPVPTTQIKLYSSMSLGAVYGRSCHRAELLAATDLMERGKTPGPRLRRRFAFIHLRNEKINSAEQRSGWVAWHGARLGLRPWKAIEADPEAHDEPWACGGAESLVAPDFRPVIPLKAVWNWLSAVGTQTISPTICNDKHLPATGRCFLSRHDFFRRIPAGLRLLGREYPGRSVCAKNHDSVWG